MLEPILGSLVREQVLLFIHINGSGYAREISRFFDAPLDSVQKQLKRLESGEVLLSENKGRTLVYRFNSEYEYLSELHVLIEGISRDVKSNIEQREPLITAEDKSKRRSRVLVKLYTEC